MLGTPRPLLFRASDEASMLSMDATIGTAAVVSTHRIFSTFPHRCSHTDNETMSLPMRSRVVQRERRLSVPCAQATIRTAPQRTRDTRVDLPFCVTSMNEPNVPALMVTESPTRGRTFVSVCFCVHT